MFQDSEEVDLVQYGKRGLEQAMEMDWMAAGALRIELEQRRRKRRRQRCCRVHEYAWGVGECAHAGVESAQVGDREHVSEEGLAKERWRKMKGRFAKVAVGREAETRCRLCYLDDLEWTRAREPQ
jgi:hypothetical protein